MSSVRKRVSPRVRIALTTKCLPCLAVVLAGLSACATTEPLQSSSVTTEPFATRLERLASSAQPTIRWWRTELWNRVLAPPLHGTGSDGPRFMRDEVDGVTLRYRTAPFRHPTSEPDFVADLTLAGDVCLSQQEAAELARRPAVGARIEAIFADRLCAVRVRLLQ